MYLEPRLVRVRVIDRVRVRVRVTQVTGLFTPHQNTNSHSITVPIQSQYPIHSWNIECINSFQPNMDSNKKQKTTNDSKEHIIDLTSSDSDEPNSISSSSSRMVHLILIA